MHPSKRKQIDPIEQAIELALSPGSFISYKAAWSFLDDVQEVANDIENIIREEPERAANLSRPSLPLAMKKQMRSTTRAVISACWFRICFKVGSKHVRVQILIRTRPQYR
jgi:hypothetical protein